MNLDDYKYLQEFIIALNDEIAKLEQFGESEIRVFNGELVKIEGSEYIYSFSTDELVIITDDQPIEIFFTGKRYKGAYIGKSGNKILVSCSENIGEKIESESSLFLPSSF